MGRVTTNNNIYIYYILLLKKMTQGWGVCKRLINYLTFNLFLYIFFAQSNYFYYLCNTKENNNLNIQPL